MTEPTTNLHFKRSVDLVKLVGEADEEMMRVRNERDALFAKARALEEEKLGTSTMVGWQENADLKKRIRELEAELASLKDIALRAEKAESFKTYVHSRCMPRTAPPLNTYEPTRGHAKECLADAGFQITDGTGHDGKAPDATPSPTRAAMEAADRVLCPPGSPNGTMSRQAVAIAAALEAYDQAKQESGGG